MGAGKGGDGGGGGEAVAVAPEAAQPVVLKMDLHCAGCAHKVKKAIKRFPGVDTIVTDVAANRVVVAGTADAGALKARLEAKTSKPVEIVSAGGGGGGAHKKPAAAEPAGAGEKKGASPKEEDKEKEKKQSAEEEKKPKQQETTTTTVLLKIRLHCDGCADRIRRRIYKIKGVKDVVLEGNAKDEVKVTGTMDIPNMLSYLKEKLNRDVEAVAPPANKKDDNKDSDKNKSAAVAGGGGGGDDKKDKGKGIDVSAGPSTAAAAAFMAAPSGASTYHVAPPYGYVAYQQAPPPPAASYYPYPPYYGNGDGMGHANPAYYHQPQQQPQVAYPPDQYRYVMAPAPQLFSNDNPFSDENPNNCSVM